MVGVWEGAKSCWKMKLASTLNHSSMKTSNRHWLWKQDVPLHSSSSCSSCFELESAYVGSYFGNGSGGRQWNHWVHVGHASKHWKTKSQQEDYLRQFHPGTDVMASLPTGLFTAHAISGELHRTSVHHYHTVARGWNQIWSFQTSGSVVSQRVHTKAKLITRVCFF